MYSAWTMHSAQSDAIIAHQISSRDVLGLDDALGALTTREHSQQHLLRRRCFAQSDPRPIRRHLPARARFALRGSVGARDGARAQPELGGRLRRLCGANGECVESAGFT